MRTLALALALAFTLPLAACDSAEPDAPVATADSRTIGVGGTPGPECPDCPTKPEDCSEGTEFVCSTTKEGVKHCACILD